MKHYLATLRPPISAEFQFVPEQIEVLVLAESRTAAEAAFEKLRPGWFPTIRDDEPSAEQIARAGRQPGQAMSIAPGDRKE
jgi:hypothetical protein